MSSFPQFIRDSPDLPIGHSFVGSGKVYLMRKNEELKKVFSLLYLIFVYTCAIAQQRQDFLFTYTGFKQGLASNDVSGVQQDKKGFIWISTFSGLQRYDGKKFISFRHSVTDPKSIPNDVIFSIHADKQNRLWMHFEDNRMGYINVDDFSYHEVPVDFKSTDTLRKATGRMLVDRTGNIFLVLYNLSLLRFDEKVGSFSASHLPFRLPEKWHASWISQDSSSNYWISCDSGLVKFDAQQKQLLYRNHNESLDPIIKASSNLRYVGLNYMDRADRFWIFSWWPGGPGPFFYSFDKNTGKSREWEPHLFKILANKYHEIATIKETSDGTLWLAGVNILARLRKNGEEFEWLSNNLPGEFSLRYDMVRNIFEDREHNIWLGTNVGLFRFNPTSQLFHTVTNKRPGVDSAYSPDVTDVLQTKEGDILVSTWGNGIFAYDNDFSPVVRGIAAESRKHDDILSWCIHQHSNGDIWRGTQNGFVFITNSASGKTTKVKPDVFEGRTIRQIAEDSKGDLWFGTQGGHVVKYSMQLGKYTLVQKINSIVLRIMIDKNDWVWVCTENLGLYKINSNTGEILNHYSTFAPAPKKITDDWVSDIVQYNDSIYIFSAAFLNVLNVKTDSIYYLTPDQGYPNNTVMNIVKDKRGYLWVTADNGISSINFDKKVNTTYNERDGIRSNTYHVGAATVLNDGRIAIGTHHDIIVFDPSKIGTHGYDSPPDITITGLSVVNQWVNMDSLSKLKQLELNFDQNSIVIEYSTLTFLNSYGVFYMLEGLDKDWVLSKTASPAVYSYIPPGTYTFKARAPNGDGEFSKTTVELKIRVNPPLYKTWWFFSLIALSIAAVLFWLDRERVQRISQQQEMRTAVATELHKEVSTALSNINVLSEIARIKADKNLEQSKEYIGEIHSKSREMMIAMNDMLWSLDPRNDSMPQTIARIHEVAQAMRSRHEADIEIETGDNVSKLKLDMKQRHEFIIIYKLAMTTLIEELDAPMTHVQLEDNKGKLQLRIFSPEIQLPRSNNKVTKSISEMQTRAASVDARLDIDSAEKGTCIELEMKI